ncbi:pyrroline-5-carboxylate reductase [Roseimaritima ulvae]|uniref:Pyrroline-5-carboxylate reductase n=1 Tax=Roseimaritima ulvae TaxID=980254 RepID=A0A5B9QUH3_9BACT|nr:pyrroline-5-carboxylate reductase [Roseimaritima ulvae]QEG42678.1 Pyrroline-5-carboxylate reductase [Roseimaritima ulvae]
MNRIEGKLVLLGGGKMGRALIKGVLSAGVTTESQLTVVEPHAGAQQWWRDELPGVSVTGDGQAAIEAAQIVLVAVKPNVVQQVAGSFSGSWGERLVISIAAGVTLERLQNLFDSRCVVRVMPNTPCLVGAGASAYACGEAVSSEQAATVAAIFSAVGVVDQVDEQLLDAVTGLSGSGPAYVFVIIEALADGGVAAGLPRPLAMQLATQTVLGAAQLLQETGEHPAALKDAVASPGGTTIAGLSVLEQNGLRSAMIEAVKAATERSRALGSHA